MLTATLLYLLFMFLAMSLFRLSSRHSRSEEQRDSLLIPTIVREQQRAKLEVNLRKRTEQHFERMRQREWDHTFRDMSIGDA